MLDILNKLYFCSFTEDIDECKETPGRCGVGTCNNRGGYYYCTCPQPGYREKWHPSGQTCEGNEYAISKLPLPPFQNESCCSKDD